jgi:L-2-hydroxycarboxylate dehydrogenase (NAD+)
MREGKEAPEGWAIDSEGKPITSPKKFFEEQGALLPLGGTLALGSHKGFGLAILVDILCSVLSGSLANAKTMGNQFFGAIRIDGFMPTAEFKKAMDEMLKGYKALPRAKGVDRIYIAGEMEQEIEQKRRRDGIPLNPRVIASLQEVAKELDIEYDL